MKKTRFKFTLMVVAAFILVSCSVIKTINIFSIEDEKTFGQKAFAQIQQDTKEYPILDKTKNPVAYQHVERIFNTIMQTGLVNYTNEFEWQIQIINANVLNAFATPGGKVYIYSGLIEYLDNEAQLAGVIAHEIAHIHWRHSTRQMTQNQGVGVIQAMLLGENKNALINTIGQLAGNATGLMFSRSDEYEADNTAVKFLSA